MKLLALLPPVLLLRQEPDRNVRRGPALCSAEPHLEQPVNFQVTSKRAVSKPHRRHITLASFVIDESSHYERVISSASWPKLRRSPMGSQDLKLLRVSADRAQADESKVIVLTAQGTVREGPLRVQCNRLLEMQFGAGERLW
jgi:hypothetical protein